MKTKHILLLIWTSLIFSSCEPTEFDGLNVIDPMPTAPIIFPQAIGWDNRMQMSWNAFTFNESIGDGEVSVELEVPNGLTIQSIRAIRGQRIRGNIGPLNQGGSQAGSARFPSRFDRAIVPNYGENVSVTPGAKVTWRASVESLNALPSGSLGNIRVGDGLRFYFTVKLSDGQELTSVEARVILVE